MIKKIKPRSLKSDARYKDAPRYGAIIEYEGELKKDYTKFLIQMNVEMAKRMTEFIK